MWQGIEKYNIITFEKYLHISFSKILKSEHDTFEKDQTEIYIK